MDGKLTADVVLSLLGLGILNSAILLIPFALLITIMLTLGRLYRDSEIYAIKASGIGQAGLLKYASLMVIPLIIALFFLSIYSAPWATKRVEQLKLQARSLISIHALTPGQFIESRQGNWVVFVESEDKENDVVNNVFIYERNAGTIAIETAKVAKQDTATELGGEALILNNGQRYEGIPGEGGFTVLSFKQHAVRLPDFNLNMNEDDPEFKTTAQLMDSPSSKNQAELQWRLSVPLGALLLAGLAFPLSVSSPRQGRFAKLGLAIVIYLIYSNVLILFQTWIANEKFPVFPGLYLVHFVLFTVILFLFYKQRLKT